jgi:hypothetical protein
MSRRSPSLIRLRTNERIHPARSLPSTAPEETETPASWPRIAALPLPRSLWPLTVVCIIYAAATVIIPTLAPVLISDDWTYTRSVEILINQGKFEVLPVAAATLVFQVFWGGLFAFLFGMTFGVLRVSSIVLTFIGGMAFYGLCRELRINRERSALGAAVYLFNPILFTITYSFMTDPEFLALLTISSYWYVRGLRPGKTGRTATIVGSVVAALACLQRPHGALIPLGVVTYLILSRQLRFDRASVERFLRIVAIPALTTIVFYFIISRGLPHQQSYFLDEAKAAGVGQTWVLVKRLTVIEALYIGMFVGPLMLAALPVISSLVRFKTWWLWGLVVGWSSIAIFGTKWFWDEGRRMPYVPHFLGKAGPGSADLRNARPWLFSPPVYGVFTIGCTIAAVIFGLILIRALMNGKLAGRSGAGMAAGIAAWQIAGVVPQSLLFRNWIISLDRYLLPLLPFAIVLTLWALQDVRISMAIGWFVIALVAAFSIAGTRDVLVFQSNVWDMARWLNSQGVSNVKIDAGYSWDAYHLWEYSDENHIPKQTPDGPWWTDVYATATDSTYVVAGGPLHGYDIITTRPYSAWLQRKPVELHILRRHGVSGPP